MLHILEDENPATRAVCGSSGQSPAQAGAQIQALLLTPLILVKLLSHPACSTQDIKKWTWDLTTSNSVLGILEQRSIYSSAPGKELLAELWVRAEAGKCFSCCSEIYLYLQLCNLGKKILCFPSPDILHQF
ncbi:hypothetical protein Nmel_015285 [Mimus melanotis]